MCIRDSPNIHTHTHTQALGGVLIGVGVWLEIQEQTVVEVVNQQVFLAGPYLLIAAGCCIVIVSLIGMFGAFCDSKINRFLLVLVSLFFIILHTVFMQTLLVYSAVCCVLAVLPLYGATFYVHFSSL